MEELSYISRSGAATESIFEDLAKLRISVFRDFPYLYEGSVAYEKEYLATYRRSGRSFIFGVYHGAEMVGATTCIPLTDEVQEVQAPFEEAGEPIDRIFYFGESILLPAYRGRGLGHRFFDERESYARSFGTFTKACFLSVEREAKHPEKPTDYRPNDPFWIKRGYQKHPAIRARMEWPDIGEKEPTPKSLICWMMDL